MVRDAARRDANIFARRLSHFLECKSWLADCPDLADDYYFRKYSPNFADSCAPAELALPPERATCLPLCRKLLESASVPRKAVDELFSPANEHRVRNLVRIAGSFAVALGVTTLL